MNRRSFLQSSLASAFALPFCHADEPEALPFKISLAEWSLHRTIFKGGLKNLDFPAFSKERFGITAVEYVSGLFETQTPDEAYLAELKKRCDGKGVESLLIMVDGAGAVGLESETGRKQTLEKHRVWLNAAQALGCHSIRVNAHGQGANAEEKAANCVKGLTLLAEAAAPMGLNVLVENHGGLSSNGAWLAGVLKQVDLPNCGSLPDFGNFVINRKTGESYDRYQGLHDLMPYAKAVSAKTHRFDAKGNETAIDYFKAMGIVLEHGYNGYVGIEYEGSELSEVDGIRATKALLERVAAAR